MTTAEMIEKLIITNLEIWHEASKIKDLDNKVRKELSMSPQERVDHFFVVRKLNAIRSRIRWGIDKQFGTGANETKIDYYTGE